MRSTLTLSRRTLWIFVILMALTLSACAARHAAEPAYAPGAAPMEENKSVGLVSDDSGIIARPNLSAEQQIERIVIKNADLTIVVPDPNQTMTAIAEMADKMGGFVVTANIYQSELSSGVKVPQATITIRVPAERLNEALAQIKSQSSQDPISENLNSQDVTSEYTDLQSQLRNLENAEAQLTEIMGSATKTEDVLTIYNQLVNVRGQIEVIKGQIKYYDQAAALSSISTNILADEAVQPLNIGGWKPVGVAKDALQALFKTLQALGSLVIWLVIFFLPVALVLAAIFILPPYVIWRIWRKQKTAKKLSAPAEKPAQE